MHRPRLTLERAWPWVVIGTIASAMISGLSYMVYSGTWVDPWGNHLRGYSVTGTLLGAVAVILGTLTFVYSLRKRGWQERLSGSGSMIAWLGLHVTLGMLAMLAAVAHAGFGSIGLQWSTGKVLLIAFTVLTLSGIVWRLIYRWVPPRATRAVGNYSETASHERAAQITTEIDKALAGQPVDVQELAARLVEDPNATLDLRSVRRKHEELLDEVRDLSEKRRRVLRRARGQRRYTRWLQVWRVLHVPAALAIPVLLVAHVVGALRVHERVLDIGVAPHQAMGSFAPSRDCRTCHKKIYEQWSRSMHAHAMDSPVTIAQNNQVVREELDDDDTPDPRLICINCHGPVGVALTQLDQEVLPLERDGYDRAMLNEGIGCVTCHQLDGKPVEGRAGLSAFQRDLVVPGNTYFGPISDPVGNAYHQSATSELWEDSEKLCRNCHNVIYDLDDDGEIVEGSDLILQRTTQEYDDYREAGGEETCLECHMPVLENEARAAEHALLWFEQDGEAPDRVVHDHSFVGVDHPLDITVENDRQRKARERLLQSAATLALAFADNTLKVTLTNSGTGHNLPTGLAFARQMWLEVIARDDSGSLVFSSGVVRGVDSDLCDANALSEPHLVPFISGCDDGADPQLVNYQQKLIDDIDSARDDAGRVVVIAATNAKESVLQRLRGGVIPRVRPTDTQKQAPLPPGTSQSFAYELPASATRTSVRLLFRSFAPYFLRTLAAGQPSNERPRLEPLIKNLQIMEMQRQELSLTR